MVVSVSYIKKAIEYWNYVKENFKTGTPIGSYPLQKSISGDKIKYGLLDTSKVKRGK